MKTKLVLAVLLLVAWPTASMAYGPLFKGPGWYLLYWASGTSGVESGPYASQDACKSAMSAAPANPNISYRCVQAAKGSDLTSLL